MEDEQSLNQRLTIKPPTEKPTEQARRLAMEWIGQDASHTAIIDVNNRRDSIRFCHKNGTIERIQEINFD